MSDDVTVIYKHIAYQLTVFIDNTPDGELYNDVRDVAMRAIIEDMGSWANNEAAIEGYETSHRNGDLYEYARTVGMRVCDRILEWVQELRATVGRAATTLEHGGRMLSILSLIWEPIDLINETQQRIIGEHYLPEPDDLIEWAQASGYAFN